jgi:hypothetical protein
MLDKGRGPAGHGACALHHGTDIAALEIVGGGKSHGAADKHPHRDAKGLVESRDLWLPILDDEFVEREALGLYLGIGGLWLGHAEGVSTNVFHVYHAR